MRIVQEGTGAGSVTLYDYEPTADRICEDVARGLTVTPKKLPPKYFYDERGARLFERITRLDAYYPTRTEIAILRRYAPEIAEHIGSHARLVEFGSGSGDKTWIILRHLGSPAAYIPVDISRTQLVEFALSVADAFPALEVVPVCADYTTNFRLPETEDHAGRSVAFFPGSTIGNFESDEAHEFLMCVRRLVGPTGGLLLGIDLRKDPAIIEKAYNDPDGVTAAFNLNLLARINRECGANFDLGAFRHQAFFDDCSSRVEMRLVSTVEQTVRFCSEPYPAEPVRAAFEAGEHITTEYSHKYDVDAFAEFAARSGWSVDARWCDPNAWFAVILLG